MTETLDNYRDTLAEIGRLAEQAVNGMVDVPDTKFDHATEAQSCTVRSLPPRLRQKAAEVAVTINPLNAPVLGLSRVHREPLQVHRRPISGNQTNVGAKIRPISAATARDPNIAGAIY